MVTFKGLEKEPAVAHNHKAVICFSPESQRAHPHCKSDAQKRHNTTRCGSCSCMVELQQLVCIILPHNTCLQFLTSEKWQHFKPHLLTNLDILILQNFLSHSTKTLQWNHSQSTDTVGDLFKKATIKHSLEESLKKETKLPRSTAVSLAVPEHWSTAPGPVHHATQPSLASVGQWEEERQGRLLAPALAHAVQHTQPSHIQQRNRG